MLAMATAMMKPTMRPATLMVEIVVSMLIRICAQSAYAITRRLVQLDILMIGLEMVCAMMKTTMLTAIMMVETVVSLMSN